MLSKFHSNINLKRIKRQILSHVKLVRIILSIIIIAILLVISFFGFKLISKSFIGKDIALSRDFIFPQSNEILSQDGRVNILILGTAGPGRGNQDEDITDTMLVASISIKSKKIDLISIPRDIWIPDLKDKINSAYMYGKQKAGIKTGIILAKSTVEKILGKDLHYGVVINFDSFKDIVDTIGGIEVDVKNSFTDKQYPIAGKENDNCNGDKTYSCRYETISFQKGIQHMDGATALKFVRSRHTEGQEGNDIAREKRQQQIINAISKKALTPKIFTNPSIDFKLLQLIEKNVQTDLSLEELATIGRFIFDARKNIISQGSIPENLLYNPPNQYLYHNDFYTHAFVFIPARKDGKWTDVENWVSSVLP